MVKLQENIKFHIVWRTKESCEHFIRAYEKVVSSKTSGRQDDW